MEVLHLCNKVPYPGRDGSSLAMVALVRVLMGAGARVTTLALNTKKHRVENPHYPSEWSGRAELMAVDAHTTPHILGALCALIKGVPYTVSRFRIDEYASQLNILLNERLWDFVVVDGLTQAVYEPELRAWGGKVVYRAHNVEYRIWEQVARGTDSRLKKMYLHTEIDRLKTFEKQVWSQGWSKWAITPEDAQEMNGWALPCTVGHWTEPDSRVPESEVFHMGALDWWPNREGLDWFISDVWPLVRAKRPETRLTVLGRGSELDSYQNPEQGIRIRHAAGTYADVTKGLGISLIPLRSGSGMRIKALDAMSNYKSIVSTELGVEGIGFIPTVHGWVANDAPSFATAVLEALEHDDLRRDRAHAARKHAENSFSDEIWSTRLSEQFAPVNEGIS